ncbi:hypothetical protein VCUG_00223 [Vavraia culicis subsp. floridensis]|uniref:Uncharacterized protein n=1 Tax=Vavraia culicis (isolate floridensis) TaxID=948595 RepID=L2GYI5_VAVCU|nr:uncharacterized protein VCUG_00223 [Vavraia culicis subsp. floridensis]ELA48387.1 hypothetical protein VCUG_00223 [Vavraia culicis subsp. floridensis]
MMKLLLIELLSFATVVMCAYGGRSYSPTMCYQVQQEQKALAEMFKEHNEKAMNAVISPYKIFLQKIDTIMTDLKRRHESMEQHQRIIDIHRQMMNSVSQSHARLRYNYVYFMVDALLPVLAHLERSEHYVSVARDLKEAIQELQVKVDDLGHECQKVGVSYNPRLYKEFVDTIAVPDIGKYSIKVWERYFDEQYRCFVQNIVQSSEETLNNVEAFNMYANLALMVRYKVYLKYIEQLNEEVKKECSAEVLGKKYSWFEISGSDLSVVVERANKPSSDWTKKYEALCAEAYRMVCSRLELENEPTSGLIRYAKVCNYACYLGANASMPLWDACLEIFSEHTMQSTPLSEIYESYQEYIEMAQDVANKNEERKMASVKYQISRLYQEELRDSRHRYTQLEGRNELLTEELNKARFDLSRSAKQQQAMEEQLNKARFDLSRSAKQQQAMEEQLRKTMIELSRSAEQRQVMEEELNKARLEMSRSAQQQRQATKEELDQARLDLSRSAQQQRQATKEELDQARLDLSRSAQQQRQAAKEELDQARLEMSRSAQQQRQAMQEESDRVMSQYAEAGEQRTEAAKQLDDFLKREQGVPTRSPQQFNPRILHSSDNDS